MPRPSKGPRLYLRKRRYDSKTGKQIPDVYVIRDGPHESSTGAGADRLGEAERALSAYLADKHTPREIRATTDRRPRDPAEVFVANVLAYYTEDRAPSLASAQASIKTSFKHLLAWWGDKTCADVIRSTCKAYVAHRTSQRKAAYKNPEEAPFVSDQTARRELEDLSAAIGHWNGEYPFTTLPNVWLPPKQQGSRDAMSRAQAARLLKAAMGWKLDAKTGAWTRNRTSLANRMHLRRFILIGLYTGPRQTVMRKLLWAESASQAWVDLEAGVIYRRGKQEREHATKRRTVVKIPPRLLAHMRRWQRLDAAREAKARMSDPDYRLNVVLHFGGQPLGGKIRTAFEGSVRDAGLSPEITPHWMRHTAATWLMLSGVELYKAAAYLGMTVAVLEKHYGHHQPDFQGDASKRIQKRVSG
jgi:integrase